MAQGKAAIKAHKQSLKKSLRNKSIKTKIKTYTKKFEECINTSDLKKMKIALESAESIIMRAVTRKVLKLNTASRKVSKLTHKFKRLEGSLSNTSSK